MTQTFCAACTAMAAVTVLLAACATRAEEVATRKVEHTVTFAPGVQPRITVHNVLGAIRVTPGNAGRVRLEAAETIRGDTAADVARARKEVALGTERDDTGVTFRVRRVTDDGCDCDCPPRWKGYSVSYDIALTVPADASVELSTVSGGDIDVTGVHGGFEVSNVNGSVTLHGLRSAGHARTVNGHLDATFEQAPGAPTSFETVNGPIDVAFPAGLSADLAFKTVYGQAWTNFDVEPLPLTPVETPLRSGGGFRISSDARAMVRVGNGGPVQSFATLNGDINVHRQEVR